MEVKGLGSQILFLVVFLSSHVEGYNILAYWALNGSESGLTLHGGPTFVEGRYPGSKAINFDQPSNCFARIPKFELRGRSFAIAVWINVKNILPRLQVILSDWYSPWQFFFFVNNLGNLVFQRHASDTRQWYSITSEYHILDTGKWHHVAHSWDHTSGTAKLFKDGNEVKAVQLGTGISWYGPTKDTYEIGADGHWHEHQFLGSVADLYVLDGALDREQLMNLIEEFTYFSTNFLNNTLVYTNETLYCQAYGFPPPYVAWVYSGVVLVNETSKAEIKIRITNGDYQCIASNRKAIKKAFVQARAPFQLCHDYHIITDVSRAVSHVYQASKDKDDNKDMDFRKWYRIQSPAGNQLPTSCVPQNNCGARAPGWLNGAHPSTYDGIVKRTVCFHLDGDCCYQNTTVQIRKCFGFYLYKFGEIPKGLAGARYCIINEENSNADNLYSTFATSQDGQEALANHYMYSEAEVQKFSICMNYCILSSECKSFNYSTKKKICELNNASRQEYPGSLLKNDSFAYYEKLHL